MAVVRVYLTRHCPYCRMALQLLERKGAEIELIRVDTEPERRKEMIAMTGRTSVPQIFIGDHHVGGYSELAELDMDEELDPMLQA